MKRLKCLAFLVAVATLAQFSAGQVTLIEDNFNADTSANYSVVYGGGLPGMRDTPDPNHIPDGSVTFAVDYSTLGIPLAPNTTDGSTIGVKMTANDTPNVGGVTGVDGDEEGVTLFHDLNISGDYTLQVDMYLGVQGIAGTTEHGVIGVAGNGTTTNQLFRPVTGSGHYVAISSDSDTTSDYRHFAEGCQVSPTHSATGGIVNTGDITYLNDGNSTQAETNFFFAIFPNSPWAGGSPGNDWATITVEVLNSTGRLNYYIDSSTTPEPVKFIDSPLCNDEGQISLGINDLFTSIADPFQSVFVIYDNLTVIGEDPGTPCDLNGDTVCNTGDVRVLYDNIALATVGGPSDLDGSGIVDNADIGAWLTSAGTTNGKTYEPGDVNLDGGTGGGDFTTLAANFGGAGLPGAYWDQGNFDGNTGGTFSVGGGDFTNLAANFGNSSVSAVPEPSCLALLAMGLVSLGLLRRNR